MANIAVVGAGAVGLSSAVNIQKLLPRATVTIIAEKFDIETTSDGAAGLFRPDASHFKKPDVPQMKQWSKDSWDYYHSLYRSADAYEAGVSMISGYQIAEKKIQAPLTEQLVLDYRELTEENIKKLFPDVPECKYGIYFTTLLVECRWFLPYLMKRFQNQGGRVQRRKIKSFEELAGHYDLIVNCTGYGSRELLGDEEIVPNRGQVIRMKAPWVKHIMFHGSMSYIVPGREHLIVGGTRQVGNTNLAWSEEDHKGILERAYRSIPSLRAGKVDRTWVGLRPIRSSIRVEKEILRFGNKTVKMVHNYGHGGHGVALGWGCGMHAARLATESLNYPSKL